MTNYFHDPEDLKLMRELKQLAPEEFKAWLELDKVVGLKDRQIPPKYRELIALAVAHCTQCVYCLDAHAKKAKKAGATREEIAETIFIAAALRAGAAAAHGTMTLKLFDQA